MQAENQFFRLVLDNSPNLIFVKDADSVFLYMNPAGLSLFPPDQRDKVVGFTMTEAFSAQEADLFLKEDLHAFAAGRSEIIEELMTYDGLRRVLHTRKIAFRNADGELRLLGISNDITKLSERERQLTESNAHLADFSSLVAHDLRSPLSTYVSTLETIRADPGTVLSPASDRKIEKIIDSAINLSKAMHSLLKAAKGRRTTREDGRSLCDLNLLLSQIRFNLGKQLDETGMGLYAGRLPGLNVDAELFRQLFQNLVENAIKYRRKDRLSKVTFRYDRTASSHRLVVEDNGVGVSSKNALTIFRMFDQGERHGSDGVGIGLALCKRIVSLHGGRMRVDENYAHGCRFLIDLPLDLSHDTSMPAGLSDRIQSLGRSETVVPVHEVADWDGGPPVQRVGDRAGRPRPDQVPKMTPLVRTMLP